MTYSHHDKFRSRRDYAGIVHLDAFGESAGAGLPWMNTLMCQSRFLAPGLLILLFGQCTLSRQNTGMSPRGLACRPLVPILARLCTSPGSIRRGSYRAAILWTCRRRQTAAP